jgi:hypothetical protein
MTSPYRWPLTAFRDLGLNVFGFLLMFAGAAPLGVGVRTGMVFLALPLLKRHESGGAPEANS